MALGSLNPLAADAGGDVAQLNDLMTPLRTGVAEGGRFGISFRSDARGRLFVAPWTGPEPFFRDGQGAADLPGGADNADPDADDNAELREFFAEAGAVSLAYGYPLFADENGLLTPLLYCDVVLREDGGHRRIVKKSGAVPRLHQAPLLAAGFDRSVAEAAADAVEHGNYRSLADCLGQVFALIGWSDPPFDDTAVTELPASPSAGWHNAAAVFLRPAGPALRKLHEELARLPDLYGEAINPTALHALAAPQTAATTPGTAAMAEIAPMAADVLPILQRCLSAPLAAIQAPPGTTKPSLILNLIASLVIDGQSVLLVAPSESTIEHLAGRLQALLAPEQHWVPRPDAADMLDLLLQSIERLRDHPTGSDEPAGGPEGLRVLVEQRQGIAALHRQVDAIRKAHRHLATRQRWRRGYGAEISENWSAVYEQKTRLEIDADEARGWRDEARMPSEKPTRGRRGSDNSRDTLTTALEGLLAPLPTLLRDELLRPIHQAPDEETGLALLADAFDSLARFAEWRRAAIHEAQAIDTLQGAPTGERLLQQFTVSRTDVSRISRDLLRRSWRSALTTSPGKAAERLATAFDAMDRRALAAGSQHAVGERQLGKVIGALSRQYPVWMVTADQAAMRMPLVDGLFDVLIVDDADRLPSPALLPLLARARRGVVFGAAPPSSAARPADAMSLCWTRPGVERHRLETQARSHPQIVDYLAATFNGGRLTPVVDYAAMGETIPAALQGLHWVDAATGRGTPAALAADLVAAWLKAPLPDRDRPFTVGIAAADPPDLAAVDAAIAERGLSAILGERLLAGAPERFVGAVVDVLVLLPGIDAATTAPRAARLSANLALFHDTVSTARGGLHAVGDAAACLAAGGYAAALAEACHVLAAARQRVGDPDDGKSPRSRLAALLNRSGLAHWPVPGGFRAVGTLGQRYHLEMPGEVPDGGWIAPDDPALVPVIVDPFDLRSGGDKLKARLDRLV